MPDLSLLPTWYVPTAVFALGAIVGSFLNVVIYRFHTGRSLTGRSHCLSCGAGLRWFELVPLASYLMLHGRCRHCGSWVPVRYLLVEGATALLFFLALLVSDGVVEFLLLAAFSALGVVIIAYDIYHYVIPNEFVCAALILALLQHGWWWYHGVPLGELALAVPAAVAGSMFFFILWYLSRGQWLGFGDVKLALPLGLAVGASGVFSVVVLSFWIGAAVSVGLVAYWWLRQRGQPALQFGDRPLTMKSAVPFAPFLVASYLTVRFFHIDVLTLLTHVPG